MPGWDDGHNKEGNKEGGGDIPYCATLTAHCAHEVRTNNDPDKVATRRAMPISWGGRPAKSILDRYR
jgi:hypothetical protein